ncbi:MAG: tRNA (adenosine(37)-N6)-threonylcarbamoyltransferase complex dimerization subunit type 1 TsaB [Chlamydiae bacterium]|nr:tRNA (adenosine(37)-N6)-threonylcarbamoyltransferase complex dimerization subunit type 1 TsaB [Chlamydiota bacterium]
MKILFIDTSDKKAIVALLEQGTLLAKKEFEAIEQQKFLIPAIDELISNTPIEAIAICVGPGSFTGTRIGVMTGKALAFALNLPLIPFNSLLPYHKEKTLTLRDAKNGFCFCFDGSLIEKIPYSEVLEKKLPVYAKNPESIPLETNQATLSFEKIVFQPESEEITLIY